MITMLRQYGNSAAAAAVVAQALSASQSNLLTEIFAWLDALVEIDYATPAKELRGASARAASNQGPDQVLEAAARRHRPAEGLMRDWNHTWFRPFVEIAVAIGVRLWFSCF